MKADWRAHRWQFGLPLLMYFGLVGLYLFAVPVGESPDEPGHVQCIEQVSLLNQLPRVEPPPAGEWWSRSFIISGRMCYHMPLYYLLAGAVQKGVTAVTGAPLQQFVFPPSNPLGPRPMFLHGEGGAFWRLQDTPALLAVRLFSLLLSSAVLVAAYQSARLLFPGEQQVAGTAVLLIAGWPQFLYMSRAVNNDSLATAVAVLILILMLCRVGQPHRYIWAALLVVLALLSKLTTIFVMGVMVGGWLLEVLLYRRAWRAYLGALLLCLLIWLGAFWLIGQHPILGENLRQSQLTTLIIPARAQQLSYWRDVFLLALSSGWARFGWMDIYPPVWHAYIWWALLAALIVPGLLALWRQANSGASRWRALFALLWLAGVLASFVRINVTLFQPQFRFAWASLPVLATLTAKGAQVMTHRHPTWQRIYPFVLSLCLIAYNLWLMDVVLGGAYRDV